jgi:hypothetical protein
MASLRHEGVLQSWNRLVENGAGHGKEILDAVEEKIRASKMPDILWNQREASSGFMGAKRWFLVIGHRNLNDYRMYIGARDFGLHLDVSWYLTVQPSTLKRAFSKYTMGNPNAISMQMDFFRQQDLSACVGYAHKCVMEEVEKLLQQLGQDPRTLNTKSKGFLELW